MEKLYNRIDWHNNTSPAINETNLNRMSKAVDDIDDRVVDIAGTVMETVPQIQEDLAEAQELIEDAEEISTHPPIIGQNGNWWVWDTSIDDYADSGVDAGVSLSIGSTTTLPAGSDATVTNTGTATDPVLNFGIPQGETGQAGAGVSTGGTTGQVLKKKSGTNYDTEWGALATSKGSATKGVYFDANGAVQEMSYTVGKSVPSNAEFTDTHVRQVRADDSSSYSYDYRVLLSNTSSDITENGYAKKSSKCTVNPYTGNLNIVKINGVDVGDSPKFTDSGHTILDGSGSEMNQRGKLQFDGATVTDDGTNDKTVVTLPTPDYVDAQFNSSTTYSKGMTCIEGNVRYRYKNSTATSGHRPPDTTYWEELSVASELEWKYLGVVKTTTQSVSDLNNLEISVPTSAKEIQIKCFVNAYTNTFGAGCDPQDASNTSFPFAVKFVAQICKDAFSKDSYYDSVPIPVYGSAPPRVITGYIGYENNKVFLQSLYYNAPISMIQYRELWVKGGTNNLNRLYDSPIAECCYIKVWYR